MQRCDDICNRLGRYTPRCIADRLDFDFSEAVQEAIEVIHILSDAKPVVHGRDLSADWDSLFECSVCHWTCWDTYTGDTDTYNYCPNCGAKMDGEEDG